MKDMNSFVERNRQRMDSYCENVMDLPHDSSSSSSRGGGGEEYERMFEGEEGVLVKELEVIVSYIRMNVEKIGKAFHVLP